MACAALLAAITSTAHAQTAVTFQAPNLSGAVAGSLDGDAGVSPRGASTYVVPIKVPPGTAGMEPALALAYDSQGTDGLLGLGWTISGLSTITRCPAILAADAEGIAGRVGLNAGDRYCLDGQRLVQDTSVSGTYGAAAQYRTEVDGISRITSYGSDPAIGPTSWKVETKSSHRVLYYGATADSYVIASGTQKPLAWALNRIEDKRGNYLTIEYGQDTATGEHYPTRIRYTGKASPQLVPYAAVRFQYETATRPDPIKRYVAGSKTSIAKRLSKISTWINTAADGTGGTLVSETRITYVVSPSSKRSLVNTIRICGDAGTCLPATSFAWTQRSTGDNNFSAPGSGVWGGPPVTFKEPYRTLSEVLRGVKYVDVNGDGRTDILASLENGTWRVCLSTGTAFSCQIWNGPNKFADDVLTGDFNGDGRTDLMVPAGATGSVCLSTGSAFNCSNWPHTLGYSTSFTLNQLGASFKYLVGDFTGDGRDDVMVLTSISGSTRSLCRSLGNSFSCANVVAPGYFDPHVMDYAEPEPQCNFNQTQWSPSMGDFNGDKRTDVVFAEYRDLDCFLPSNPSLDNHFDMCLLGDTSATCATAVSGLGQTRGGLLSPPDSMVGDLNGDGYADFVLHSLGTVAPLWQKVCLSKGDGGVDCTDYMPAGSGEGPELKFVADFDGDGRADVLKFGYVCQGLNGSLSCAQWTTPLTHQANEVDPIYADFDGDGKTDLGFYNLSGTWRVALANGSAPDLLASVTDGLGHETQFDYQNTNVAGFYTPGGNISYPKRNDNAGRTLVSQMRVANAIGGWLVTDYEYQANRIHQEGRGPLDFAKTRSIDRVKEITTEITRSQDHPRTGMTTLTTATQANGTVLQRVTNTLADFVTAGTARYPYVATEVIDTRDLNGALMPLRTTAVAASDIDAYGNVRVATETIEERSGAGSTYVTTTTRTYDSTPARVTSWLIDLPLTTTVTKSTTSPTAPPLPPVLTLTNCTSTTPTLAPAAAVMTCRLGNASSTAATAVNYSGPSGTTRTGPASCAANTSNCGTVTVTSGTTAGFYSGTLSATPTPAGGKATAAVTLQVQTAAPTLQFAACTSISPTAAPERASRTCTVRNAGQAAATSIAYASPVGTTASGPPSCPAATLDCGKVTVTTGTAAQTYSGTLTATPTPSGTADSVSISLVVGTPPALTLTGCTANSPTATPTPATLTCVLGNTGGMDATAITYASPSGTTRSGPATCAANTANCGNVVVTTGTAAATYSGNLTATPTPNGSAASAAVSLVVQAVPDIAIAPSALAFGTVAKNANSAPATLTVTNSGSATATINWALTYTGGLADSGFFTGNDSSCASVAAQSSCVLTYRFNSGCTGGPRNATLTASGSNFTSVSVTLTGTTSSSGICN